MSRFRLYPTSEQELLLLRHCGDARYIWNLCVEQLGYRHHHQLLPGYAEQGRQLTEARAAHAWLRDGSNTVQQQALRDFAQAMANWRGGKHKRPTWRKQGRHEGFRIVGDQARRVQVVNRRWSRVLVPKIGWVRFRRTRPQLDAKSYRVTMDTAGRWHISFTVAPLPIAAPGNFEVVGVDRGVAVTLAYSDGTMLKAPEPVSVRSAAQALARCKRGSRRRRKAKLRLARVHSRNADRRRDFIEKSTTDLARRFDLIRIEDLRVGNMSRSARGTVAEPGRNVRQKAGLNRSILAGGWGQFARRLMDKAPGRVETIDPAFTSQMCSRCRHVDRNSRKSQALFLCTACGYTANADVNAACNIAAGRAVRGAENLAALKREPQLASP